MLCYCNIQHYTGTILGTIAKNNSLSSRQSLITSSIEVVRAYVQAHLIDRDRLSEAQANNDPIDALRTLKVAFTTDVAPILALARERSGGAIDPIGVYRSSGYRKKKSGERPSRIGVSQHSLHRHR